MQVEIKILGQAITQLYGTLSTGDILRCDKAFADHLVNDCKVAEYIIKSDGVLPVATPKADEKVQTVETAIKKNVK